MRRILIGSIAVTLAVATTVDAQTRRNLDDPVGIFFVPNPLPPCAMATAILELERTAFVLAGFERTPQCSVDALWFPDPSGQTVENLSGMTIRQVLDRFMSLDPTFEWRDVNGIAVIRPFNAWADTSDALNAPASAFTITNGQLRDGIAAAIGIPGINVTIADAGAMANKRFSLAFTSGTRLDALNAVIDAHAAAVWDLGWLTVAGASPVVDIMVRTFDQSGFSVGTAIGIQKQPH